MNCDHCNNQATVFFTQIIDGVSSKQCLCDQCATEQGVTDPSGFISAQPPSPQELTEESLPTDAPVLAPTEPTPQEGSCPECGFAFDDLKKTGRMGCSNCYQFFREEIKANITGMHKGNTHTGRVPAAMMAKFQFQSAIATLQVALDQAIAEEDYEKAAALRDEIQRLTEGENTPS